MSFCEKTVYGARCADYTNEIPPSPQAYRIMCVGLKFGRRAVPRRRCQRTRRGRRARQLCIRYDACPPYVILCATYGRPPRQLSKTRRSPFPTPPPSPRVGPTDRGWRAAGRRANAGSSPTARRRNRVPCARADDHDNGHRRRRSVVMRSYYETTARTTTMTTTVMTVLYIMPTRMGVYGRRCTVVMIRIRMTNDGDHWTTTTTTKSCPRDSCVCTVLRAVPRQCA